MPVSRISVIVPIYNGEKYLERCVESVLRQEFSKWELILVDDGSSDRSAEIIRAYAAANSRIKALCKSNQGVVRAREDGVDLASGEFLFFLDCDDYLTPDALQLLYATQQKYGSDLVIARYALHWSQTDRIVPVVKSAPADCSAAIAVAFCLDAGETFLPIKLFRKSLYEKSVKIPANITYMEDTVGVLQYLSVCEKVSYISEVVYFYFKHSASACYRHDSRQIASMIAVCKFLNEYSLVRNHAQASATVENAKTGILYQLRNRITREEFTSLIAMLQKPSSGIEPRLLYWVCRNNYKNPRRAQFCNEALKIVKKLNKIQSALSKVCN